LLKIAQNKNLDKGENSEFPISLPENFINSNSTTFIDFVELFEGEEENIEERHKETWKDQAMKIGCIAFLIMAIISFGVGLVTMVNWVF